MDVWTSLIAVVQRISRAADAAMDDAAVNPAQYLLLATLDQHGPSRQRDLCRRLGTTPANVSQLLKKLEAVGLVQRHEDGAAKVSELTAAGRDVLGVLRPAHRAFIGRQFAALDDHSLQALRSHLRRLLTDP